MQLTQLSYPGLSSCFDSIRIRYSLGLILLYNLLECLSQLLYTSIWARPPCHRQLETGSGVQTGRRWQVLPERAAEHGGSLGYSWERLKVKTTLYLFDRPNEVMWLKRNRGLFFFSWSVSSVVLCFIIFLVPSVILQWKRPLIYRIYAMPCLTES